MVTALHNYLSTHAAETSWGTLLTAVTRAENVAAIAAAHDAYLRAILEKMMLLPRAAKVLEYIHRVLAGALRFAQLLTALGDLQDDDRAYAAAAEAATADASAAAAEAAALATEAAAGEDGDDDDDEDEEGFDYQEEGGGESEYDEVDEVLSPSLARRRRRAVGAERLRRNVLRAAAAAARRNAARAAAGAAAAGALGLELADTYTRFTQDLTYVNAVGERLVATRLAPYLADVLLVLDFNGFFATHHSTY